MNERTIVAVRVDSIGRISDVKLTDGVTMSVKEAITLAKQGELPGYTVGGARDGSATLRGVGDGSTANNLTSLPRF